MSRLLRKLCVIEDNTAAIEARRRRPVYVLVQNTYNYDNRQVHIAGAAPALDGGGGWYKGRQVIELPGGAP